LKVDYRQYINEIVNDNEKEEEEEEEEEDNTYIHISAFQDIHMCSPH
jgi:hypothetical protein